MDTSNDPCLRGPFRSLGTATDVTPLRSAMLKFLGVEEKTCDLLTGAFCSDEEKLHMEYFTGKPMEDLKNELKVLSKKSGETLKKDERTLVDGRLKVLKKLMKALKKSNAKWESRLKSDGCSDRRWQQLPSACLNCQIPVLHPSNFR